MVEINNGKNKENTLLGNKECSKQQNIPQPRSSGNIDVNFTPRQLTTPARESKLPEEEMVSIYILILINRAL